MNTLFPRNYPSLVNDNLLDVLRLIRTLNVGPVTFFHLIQRFATARAALEALPALAQRGGRRQPLQACPKDVAERELQATQKFGARMMMYGTPGYPTQLYTLNDPPPIITVIGNMHLWEKDAISIVGARNASANGCQFAHRLARDLGENGLTVVSGLARGIDTYVHKGSLASGTIAVIAGGIDTIYPPENAGLYALIKESGVIISEQPFAAVPFSGSFPGRNRIIAALGLGTVVVEAAPKSGSLITARFALENNREVFAVPGSPIDPRAKGCNQLIRDGATMVEGVSDVLQGIAHLRNRPLGESDHLPYVPDSNAIVVAEGDLANARRRIIEKLGITPVAVDELITQCELTPGPALTVLLELELAGRLTRSPGNKVQLLTMIEEVA